MSSPARLGPGARAGAVAIVLAAAALRLWHIDKGIPYAVGPDEPQVMQRVAHMMRTGDFNPHFFDWPTLTFYLNLVVSCVTFLAGAMRGAWSDVNQIGPDQLYYSGRVFTALLGAGTVALTFAAGRRWGTAVGLVSAALMAVIPAHVRESHFVLTDVPTAFFTTLTLVLSLRAHEQRTVRSLIWAALGAGLSASCKYNGAMVILMPLCVALSWPGGFIVRLQQTLTVFGVAAAGFFIGTPYAIFDLPKFLSDYARLAANFARRRGGEPGWSLYVKHLSSALAWPAFVAGLAGLVFMLRRLVTGPDRTPVLMMVTFALVYFTVMARSFQIYGRYMLPLYPVLCVFAASAIVEAVRWLPRARTTAASRAAITAVLVTLVLVTPAYRGVDYGRTLGRKTTVDRAYQWMLVNVPKGAKVVIESGAFHLPPEYHTVGIRRLVDRGFDDYQNDGVHFLVAASPEYAALLRDGAAAGEPGEAYRVLLQRAKEVAAFDPAAGELSPSLRVFQIVH